MLLTVLVVLALLGLTGLALFAATRAGQEGARRLAAVERVRDAARSAPVALLDGWAGTGFTRLAVGAARDTVLVSLLTGDTLAPTARVRRASPAAFLLASQAAVVGPGTTAFPFARRTTQLVALLVPARLALRAALTSREPLRGDAATLVDGRDTLPEGWACDPADSGSVPAIALPPSATAGLPPGALLGAAPHVLVDSGSADVDRYRLVAPPGTAPAARPRELPSLRGPTVGPRRAADGDCDVAHDDVWGDPARASPCGDYLPLLHVAGDLVAPRGQGQGVLVVDGDLVLDGGFEFLGVVLVGGRVVGGAMPSRVMGALLVRGSGGAPSELGALRVRWSSCVAAGALRAVGGVRPAAARGWQSGG
ncbi:MAG TPA: hypothetical protein VFS08_11785 [Gemmatimonadaceae bacterium]|nr:hypothetical protein [Gemmatimonadaceae bacterium]